MISIPKIYTEKNVLEAAAERFEVIFSNFSRIYLCVSGGKDSSVMLQLCARVARDRARKISVMYVDMESQYKATISHVEQLREITADVVDRFYWCCMPLSLRNAVSILQPKWICWDEREREKWVREMPPYDCVINEHNYPPEWTWFRKGMEFEEFVFEFGIWFQHQAGAPVAAGIAIRSDESLNRFGTIVNRRKETFRDYGWTTQLYTQDSQCVVYNFYPLYDWRVDDIWGAVSQLGLKFNEIYELMYKNGLGIHQQRLCQPYGDNQRKGLGQFRALEPETWEKVVNRVEGVNFGNIYARTALLGEMRSEKPAGISWQEYAVFLLESIGLYAPELRDHYYGKIRTFLRWWCRHYGIWPEDMPDEADRWMESHRKIPSWRRIARALEKNDFWMRRLGFAETKGDAQVLLILRSKYRHIMHVEDIRDRHVRKMVMEAENG